MRSALNALAIVLFLTAGGVLATAAAQGPRQDAPAPPLEGDASRPIDNGPETRPHSPGPPAAGNAPGQPPNPPVPGLPAPAPNQPVPGTPPTPAPGVPLVVPIAPETLPLASPTPLPWVPATPERMRTKPFTPEVDRWYALPNAWLKNQNVAAEQPVVIEKSLELPQIYYINNEDKSIIPTMTRLYFAVGYSWGWVTESEIENPAATRGRIDALVPQPLKRLYLSALLELEEPRECKRRIAEQTEILRVNPSSFDAYYARAAAYRGIRDYPRALGDLTEALRLNPVSIDALLFRAEVNARLHRGARSEADLIEVLRLDPNVPEAVTGLNVLKIQTFDKNP